MKKGDRVKLISVPECFLDDLDRYGTVMEIHYNGTADLLLDGDDGLSVVFVWQLEKQI